ncbi:MAG: hypothetical protein JWP35_527 [Caulobacter sp.]|nr:hypothetical protein [Caulobacter sp.]
MRVGGNIDMNEGTRAMRFSPRNIVTWVSLAFGLGGLLWFQFIVHRPNRPGDWFMPIFIIALCVYVSVLLIWRRRSTLSRSGQPKRLAVSYSIGDEGMAIVQPHADLVIKWPSLLRLRLMRAHWVIENGGMRYVLPRRLFDSPQHEREFIATTLAHMTPTARAKSAAATKFAAWE